ncbi:hypothetical protein Bca52824_019656 [Brassica carinata]|uniref:FRIGIDA-like protein n=1 Tax=Brassica carinata TaxID=52824 RepID=A0A8X7VS65_BRACI|nr:hypothetical protein Bca52824_019656 [Brassica carinata]
MVGLRASASLFLKFGALAEIWLQGFVPLEFFCYFWKLFRGVEESVGEMEESKLENELNICSVRGEGLRKALDEVYAYASKRVEERIRELQSKEVELKDKSFALEERAKKVEEAEAQLVDLESEVEAKRKELNFIRNQVEISLGESNAEEVRLSQLRILVEECEAEQVLKASELSEMVESWRRTHVELSLKGEELAKRETDLEKCRDDVSAEIEILSRTQTHMRQLDEEVERKTKDLTLVQNKLAECEQLLEISSSALFKTQDELECKREHLGQMEADLERHRIKVSAEMEETQIHMRQLVEEVERKTKDLYLVQTKLLECEKLLKTSSSELIKTQGELECKQEQLGEMEADLESHRVKVSAEMESLRGTQTHMRQLVEEVERKTKDLALVQTELVECEKLLETSSSELIKTQGELECKQEQLGEMEADFQRHHAKVSAEKELWETTRSHSREMEEEIERKRKDLAMVLDKIAECGRQLESVEEKLDSQQKLLETQSSELVAKEKELQALSLDIDLREQTVISLNNNMEETCQQMESKAKELENVQMLIEERSAHCESLKLLIEEHSEELVSKEKRHDEITDGIRKLSLEIVFQEKTLERAQAFIKKLSEKQDSAENELDWTEKKLDSTTRHLERCIAKHKSKKKELRSVKDKYRECLQNLDINEKELKSVQSILTEINEQVEEGEKRIQHLNSSNEELNRQLKLKQEEVCSINKAIMECSGELKTKRKHCDKVQSSIAELNSVKKKFQDNLKDFQSKEEEQVRLRASLMEREQGLELKEKELSAREARIGNKAQNLKSTEQKLAKSSKKTDLKAKKQGNIVQQADLVRDANVCNEKTLQLLLRGHLKKSDQLHLDILSSIKRSCDPEKLVLDTIHDLYSAHQRTSVTNLDPMIVQRSSICLLECLMDMSAKPTTEVHGEAIKFATEWKNTTLVNAENPVEVLEFLHFLAAFSLAYTIDAEQVQRLFDVAFLRKYSPSLCKALGVSALAPVNNVLSLEDKPEQQPPEAPVINSSDPCSSDVQQSIASSHLPNEDSLKDFEDSTSFLPNELCTKLPVFKSPGRFVLNAVENALTDARLRGELSLKEPILMNLVPLLEELARVGISTDPDLQSDATKVAHRWVKMMGASVKKSQLEVWAFLQFIVAFRLVLKLANQDQTLKLASYVAHFKQAPKLFQSLGLSDAIPNFVTELLDKAIYIPAIRFMFYFNVENNFSPLEFLEEQIINLRRSAKEKRRYESQAEANRDASTLREMMELIEDFQLEIDIPVALILKFMVPREIVSSSVPAQSTHMQASETDIQSSCIATDGLDPSLPTSFGSSPTQPAIDAETYQAAPNQPVNVEAYQAGGSVTLQGQSSHQAGFKRPRLDPEGSRPVIRRCFNPPSGSGRF